MRLISKFKNKFKTERTVDGGMMYYIGSLENKNMIVIVGRDNFWKDDELIDLLVESLVQDAYTVIWYEHVGTSTARILEPASLQRFYKYRYVRRFIKSLILLMYPSRWGFFVPGFLVKTEDISFRAENFRLFLHSLGEGKHVIVLGRSSGGRLASLVEDEPMIKKSVCLSYPFKHPEKPIELDRVQHLEFLKKPFLIIQGVRDSYGGAEALQMYRLSPSVSVSLIDTDHDFKISKEEIKSMSAQIRNFIELY